VHALLSGVALGLAAPDLRGPVAVLVGGWFAGRALSGRLAVDVGLGLLASLAWSVLALGWVPAALADHGLHGVRAATLALVLVQAAAATLPWAVASPLVARLGPGPALAIGWLAATEPMAWLQPLPTPPALLLAGTPIALWPAAVGGAPLLSAAAMGVGAGLPRPGAGFALALGCWLGSVWLDLPEPRAATRVGIVQPDLGAFDARRASTADVRRARLLAHLRAAAEEGADWLAAPEGAWPEVLGADDELPELAGLPPVVLGASVADGPTNSLLVVVDGRATGRFDKVVRVPGVERRALGFGADAFVAGARPRALRVADVAVAPLICFEDLHAAALRDAVAGDPDVLVAAAHDAWTADGPGTAWHLGAARLAAVVTGRPVVRPTTSGRSAVVDTAGRLAWSTDWVDGDLPGVRGTHAVVEVHPAHPRLPGVVVGPWLGALALLAALTAPWWPRKAAKAAETAALEAA
jgi:apolipoprotein N-acyltransferase